jgi:hypothetical protein
MEPLEEGEVGEGECLLAVVVGDISGVFYRTLSASGVFSIFSSLAPFYCLGWRSLCTLFQCTVVVCHTVEVKVTDLFEEGKIPWVVVDLY